MEAVPKIKDLAERREADEVAVENNDAVQVNEGAVRQKHRHVKLLCE